MPHGTSTQDLEIFRRGEHKSRIGLKSPKEEKVRKQVQDMADGLELWHSSDLVFLRNVEARLTTDIRRNSKTRKTDRMIWDSVEVLWLLTGTR